MATVYKVKLFLEHQHFLQQAEAKQWERVLPESTKPMPPSLEDQINTWVDQTGNELVNPGTLTVHREYVKSGNQVRLTATLGTLVLYLPAQVANEPPSPTPAES